MSQTSSARGPHGLLSAVTRLTFAVLFTASCAPTKENAGDKDVEDTPAVADLTDAVATKDATSDVAVADAEPVLCDSDCDWPPYSGTSLPYGAVNYATAPTCLATPGSASLLPGEPTPNSNCWTWLRMAPFTPWERLSGEIAVYESLPGSSGNVKARHVYAADGKLLQVDQAAELAEQLTPVGTGYLAFEGKQVSRYDGGNQLLWSKPPPEKPLGAGWPVFPFSGQGVQFPSGNLLVYGYVKSATEYWPSLFIVTANGELVHTETAVNYPHTTFTSVARFPGGIALGWETIQPSALEVINDGVKLFQDGGKASTEVKKVRCHSGTDYNHTYCKESSSDVWPNGDYLSCANNCANPDNVSTCTGEQGGWYEKVALGQLARFADGPSTTPPNPSNWKTTMVCEVAGILPDGNVVAFGRLDGSARGWFAVDGKTGATTALPYPANYVPTVIHRSVSGGMYLNGYVIQPNGSTTPWFGRSALDGCQPLACTVW
jgi:hypothetical protein